MQNYKVYDITFVKNLFLNDSSLFNFTRNSMFILAMVQKYYSYKNGEMTNKILA